MSTDEATKAAEPRICIGRPGVYYLRQDLVEAMKAGTGQRLDRLQADNERLKDWMHNLRLQLGLVGVGCIGQSTLDELNKMLGDYKIGTVTATLE